MTEILTFESLPKAVTMLTKEVSELKQLLVKLGQNPATDDPEKLLTIQEAGKFLSLSVATLYAKTSKGELPFMKKGKRLYFSKSELLEFVKTGRNKTNSEVKEEAMNYLSNNKKS